MFLNSDKYDFDQTDTLTSSVAKKTTFNKTYV